MSNVAVKKARNPVEKKVDVLKKQKQEFDKSHLDWLKGRDIRKVEKEANDRLEKAKAEAKEIVEAAKREALGIEVEQKQIADKNKSLSGQLKLNKKLESELKAAQKEAEAKKEEYEQLIDKCNNDSSKNLTLKKSLEQKAEKIRDFITDLLYDDSNK